MTGINHIMTGSLIGKILPLPLSIPVAFMSHFLLDSLPHFGEVFDRRKRLSKFIWTLDICASALFVCFLIYQKEFSVLAAAIAAMSPDLAWIYRFAIQEKFGKLPPRPENRFNSWHVRIQRYESRLGIAFELFWLSSVILILSAIW